jgi:hypothetical protein
MGKETADDLAKQFKRFKVRYKKPQKRNLTPEQRAAAAQRVAKARAVREQKRKAKDGS